MTPPKCERCAQNTQVELRRIIMHSGAAHVCWWCLRCNRAAEKPIRYLPHVNLTVALDSIPITADWRREDCAICGKSGVQYHHYLPQMFQDHAEVDADWQLWDAQGVWLCAYHHDLWHDLVTPWMPGRGNSRKLPT